MKKIRLTSISVICIIIFSIAISGCSHLQDKSATRNNTSAISKTTGVSISSNSYDSTTIQSTQKSNSASGNNINSIDYSQYIKKVWIMKNVAKGAYHYSSFCISKIENGLIEGKFSTDAIAIPDYYYYLPDHLGYLGNLTGTINNNTAECQFSDKDGDKGNVKLVFKAKDEIEATIEYTSKAQSYKNLSLDGTMLFKPYNIKDIDGFSPFKDQCFTVNLNSWGSINFVSGKITGGNHIPTVCYLTNKDGDILYDFDSPFPYSVNVKAVSFQDVNKDGLKDIIIIIVDSEDSSSQMAKVFFQKVDGSFFDDDKLDQEINDSRKNKDIKTIVDYLAKRY